MHRIVPVAGLSGDLALQALASRGSAISPEANAVHEAALRVVEAAERSQALFGEKAAALSRLAALATDCAEPGWDGADAAAIDPIAVLWTERFVRALPRGMPLPEFGLRPMVFSGGALPANRAGPHAAGPAGVGMARKSRS